VGIHYQGECLYLNASSVRYVGPEKYGKLKYDPLASASSLGVRAVHGYISLSIVQNYVLYAGSLYLLILESRVEWTGEVPTSERFSLGNSFHEKTGESSRFFLSFLWSLSSSRADYVAILPSALFVERRRRPRRKHL